MLLLPSSVTVREARDTLRLLSQGLAREPDAGAVIGAGGLQQFDSSVLAVLLECRRLAQASGRDFDVQDVPQRLLALARLYGVGGLLFAPAAPADDAPA